MMQEAQSRGLAGSNPAKALAQDPKLVQRLQQYRANVQDLVAGDLTILALEATDFPIALELQRQHGLLTNDSLHLAAALRAGVTQLATSDPHFDGVPGLTIFKPGDLT
jgi:predicted nucleic acid-binding protein